MPASKIFFMAIVPVRRMSEPQTSGTAPEFPGADPECRQKDTNRQWPELGN
jgi:hypothetical protein